MRKTFISASFAVAALMAAIFVPAPATAQVWNQIDNASAQTNGVILQGNLAAGEATSYANDAAVTGLTAAIGNSIDIDTSAATTSYHMFGYGAVGNKVANTVNQVNQVGAQIGVALGEATAQQKATVDVTAIAIGNTGTVKTAVGNVTSRH